MNSTDARNLISSPLIICGPSGCGKGTILERFEKTGLFGRSVSHTTRQPRQGEVNGVHYHFVTVDEIKEAINKGLFLEYAQVHSNYYGTSLEGVKTVQASGKICIIEIDIQGAQQIKQLGLTPSPKFIFINPPSLEVLESRLRGRGTEKEETIQLRMKNATAEIEFSRSGFFDCVLVNDDLEKCVQDLQSQLKKWYPNIIQADA